MAAVVVAPRNQHLPVGQQRRRVKIAGGVQGTSHRPCARRRIIQFCAGKKAAAPVAPRNQHLPIGQQRRRVKNRGRCSGNRSRSTSPLAGLYSSALEKKPLCRRNPPQPAPAHWAATSPCEHGGRCSANWPPSTSPSPDYTVPRWKDNAAVPSPPPPAPARWAATSPCEKRGRCSVNPSASMCPPPDYTVLRWKESRCHCTPRNQHLPVGQQRRRVVLAGGVQGTGHRPRRRRRIIQFRAGKRRRCHRTPRDQHLPVGQQRRRVHLAGDVQRTGHRPCACRRIIQFCARKNAAVASPAATSTCPLGSNVAV